MLSNDYHVAPQWWLHTRCEYRQLDLHTHFKLTENFWLVIRIASVCYKRSKSLGMSIK